jgi:hypothetical protein
MPMDARLAGVSRNSCHWTPEPQRSQRGAPAARSARTNDVGAAKARRILGRARDRGQRGVRVP